jgi:hypothetical protein
VSKPGIMRHPRSRNSKIKVALRLIQPEIDVDGRLNFHGIAVQ